jgi:hypothetical protein
MAYSAGNNIQYINCFSHRCSHAASASVYVKILRSNLYVHAQSLCKAWGMLYSNCRRTPYVYELIKRWKDGEVVMAARGGEIYPRGTWLPPSLARVIVLRFAPLLSPEFEGWLREDIKVSGLRIPSLSDLTDAPEASATRHDMAAGDRARIVSLTEAPRGVCRVERVREESSGEDRSDATDPISSDDTDEETCPMTITNVSVEEVNVNGTDQTTTATSPPSESFPASSPISP